MKREAEYAVGTNEPGYFPSTPPVGFDTFAEARAHLAYEVRWDAAEAEAEESDTPEVAADLYAAALDIEAWTEPGTVTVHGIAYWIARD